MDTSDTDEHLSVDEDSRWFISNAVTSDAGCSGKLARKQFGVKAKSYHGSRARKVSWSTSPQQDSEGGTNGNPRSRSKRTPRVKTMPAAATSSTTKGRRATVTSSAELPSVDANSSGFADEFLSPQEDGPEAHLENFIDIDLLKPRLRPKAEKAMDYRKLVYSRKRGRRLFVYFTAFPMYIPWWRSKVRMRWLVPFNVLYLFQLTLTVLYFYSSSNSDLSLAFRGVNKVVHPFEMILPLLLITFDGFLLGYTASKMPFVAASREEKEGTEGTDVSQEIGEKHVNKEAKGIKEKAEEKETSPLPALNRTKNNESSGRSLMTIDCCSASDMDLDSSESEGEAESSVSWGREEMKAEQEEAPLVGHIQRMINPTGNREEAPVPENSQRGQRNTPIRMTIEDIRDAIEAKVHEASPDTFYEYIGLAVAVLTALLPTIYRMYHHSTPIMERVNMWTGWQVMSTGDKCTIDPAWYDREPLWDVLSAFKYAVLGTDLLSFIVICSCFCSTLTLSLIYFNSVTLAEETFRKRFLYAKYFSKLTSFGKARKSKLPHFRLNRIANIRIWLALRSRGAEINRSYSSRAGDATASMVVMVTLSFVVIVGIKILYSKDHADVFRTLDEWILLLWTTTLLFYIVRFSNLAKKTVKKLSPQALLMTEILNLQMLVSYKNQISPARMEEYQAALSTLKVLVKAIRVIDSKKDSYQKAILLNPVLYSLLRLTVLSAVGTITSKSLGFKVRLWKL